MSMATEGDAWLGVQTPAMLADVGTEAYNILEHAAREQQ